MISDKVRLAFTQAVQGGDDTTAGRLLTENPDLANDPELPLTCYLIDAVRNDHVEVLRVLIEHGADINAPDSHFSPIGVIIQAARHKATRCVKLLLEHGAKINADEGPGPPCWPLKTAVTQGYLDIVKMLVDHGANYQDWGNKNALTVALKTGQTEVADYLRSLGARDPIEVRREQLPAEADALTRHLTEEYGLPEPNELTHLIPMDPPVSIIVVRSGIETVLVTRGMSAKPIQSNDGQDVYVEVIVQLPPRWPVGPSTVSDLSLGWPVQWLHRIAALVHSAGIPLGFHAMLPKASPAEPLCPETAMSSVFLYRTPSTNGRIQDGDKVITLYQILPVYEDEVEYSKQHGIEALLDKFEYYGVTQLVQLDRISIVEEMQSEL